MKIQEMTMRGPDYNDLANKLANDNAEKWQTGKHIADIEQFKVKVSDSEQLPGALLYTLWDKDTVVAFAALIGGNEVDGVWVNPDYRGQRIFSKVLWFFKTRLNKSPLILGDIHSKDMQEVIKGLSRFEKKWINIRTQEIQPFSLDTLDNFYSSARPTAWRLMLENDGEFDWPMFRTGMQFMKEDYTELTK
jgi:hypothetical protein